MRFGTKKHHSISLPRLLTSSFQYHAATQKRTYQRCFYTGISLHGHYGNQSKELRGNKTMREAYIEGCPVLGTDLKRPFLVYHHF